jgi:hypothetical protein
MGFFWKRGRDPGQQDELAAAMEIVSRAKAEAQTDADAAYRRLRRAAKKYRQLFGEGSLLRNQFAEAVLATLAPGCAIAALPSVARVPWSVEDWAGLLQAARSSAEEILWVAHPRPEHDGDPFVELEARVEFHKDRRLVQVVIGEGPPLLFRREFLIAIGPELRPDDRIEDVGQLVADAAKRRGLRGPLFL